MNRISQRTKDSKSSLEKSLEAIPVQPRVVLDFKMTTKDKKLMLN